MSELVNRRYWVFAYQDYYPAGGLGDLRGTSDSLAGCKDLIKYFDENIDLLDTKTMKEIDVTINRDLDNYGEFDVVFKDHE